MVECFPVSTSDFKKIATEGFIFVDKSLMIRDIIRYKQAAFLFTRPRRFGKTMNLDMLRAFFDIENKDGKEMFSKLKIANDSESMAHLGKYRVIRLDLSSSESSSMKDFLESFASIISRVLRNFKRIPECNSIPDYERELFMEYGKRTASESMLAQSISYLCQWIEDAYDDETVILIDEYDKPVRSAYLAGYYEEFMEFFKKFMESTLKTNTLYRFAVVTGCSRISKETLFSGLNNLKEFDIFQTGFDEEFGFTESELQSLIKNTSIPIEEVGIMKSYYDGYRFGEKDVYNPYSVMNHLQDYIGGSKKPISYWVQSGDASLISDVLGRTAPEFRDSVISLGVPGNSFEGKVNPKMNFQNLFSTNENELEEAAITLLVTSGYLKAIPLEEGKYRFTIPNEEVFEAFDALITSLNIADTRNVTSLMGHIYSKNEDKATMELNTLLDGQSPRDHYDERVHKIFMSALFGFSGLRYQTELGSGDGFIDLYVKGNRTKPGLLIEIKYKDECDDLNSLAASALDQIRDKEYSRNIDEAHILIGLAFRKHTAKILFGSTVPKKN